MLKNRKKQDTQLLHIQFKDLLKIYLRKMILKIFLPIGKLLVFMTSFILCLPAFLTEHFVGDCPLSYRLVLCIAACLVFRAFAR